MRLARGVCDLLPGEPGAAGLLALLLLTDARTWDYAMIEEGERVLTAALRAGRPGSYQLQAAIAACHSCSVMPD